MNWIIVEDALRNRQGHWAEFVQTFKEGLEELGDEVQIIGPRNCEADFVSALGVEAILPDSLWVREKSSSRVVAALSMSRWIAASFFVLSRRLVRLPRETIIFVPTVGIPHLILWWSLLFFCRIPAQAKLLLYFMATPVRISSSGIPESWGLWGRVFFIILGRLASASRSERVTLAAETETLSAALGDLSGARFETLPQPVRSMFAAAPRHSGSILIGSYGPARYEKGSDLMVSAIEEFLSSTDRQDIKFAVQWMEDFDKADGFTATIPDSLKSDSRFIHLNHLFAAGEYAQWLQETSLMLLPYRKDYILRGSRVVLESIVHGIPAIVSSGTTLEEHISRFGDGVVCDASNPGALCNALASAVRSLSLLTESALAKSAKARDHFSVAQFRRSLRESFSSQR